MPVTVAHLIEEADCTHGGCVAWNTAVPETSGGIYLIATTADPDGLPHASEAPIKDEMVQLLLDRRPSLTLDGLRPSALDLKQRAESMWLEEEPVVYIGKATSIATRVGQYYNTSIGARSPHAGGWPLKLLGNLNELWVHWATSPMPELAEQKALARFVHSVSLETRSSLVDPDHPYPYANLEGPGGRKRHGIRGALQPRSPGFSAQATAQPADPPPKSTQASPQNSKTGSTSARVTLHDEISAILRETGNRWLTTKEIAKKVASQKRYRKRDGTSDVTAFQVHGRTKNYPDLFERDGVRVRLRNPA